MNRQQTIPLFLSLTCLSLSLGWYTGRIVSIDRAEIILKQDTRDAVPTIAIEGVRNGILHGEIIGEARVSIGKTVLTQPGIFAIDAAPLLINHIAIQVPENAQFVASKRGSKYYKIDSAAGAKLMPSNRIYFETEQEAQEAGFTSK